MAEAGVNDFGAISNGLDRAEMGVAPPADATGRVRPDVKPGDDHKPSVRKTLGNSFPNAFIHPQHEFRRVKRAVKEKHEGDVHIKDVQKAPVLAPEPPLGFGDERMHESPTEKKRMPSLETFVRHPVTALKSVACDEGGGEFAANIAKSEVSHTADVRLLRQDIAIDAAEDAKVEKEQEIFVQHKHARQDAFVRWSIDRHVRRVGVNPEPPQPGPWPSFGAPWEIWKNHGSKVLVYGLEKHGEHYLDLSPEWTKPTEALLASAFERVIVASTPLQSLFIQLRDVSHWKNPRRSAGWMIAYFICLIYSQITRMAILALLASVLYRRWHPPPMQEMHDTIRATEDKSIKAQTLSQLILKHGTRGWVDKMIEEAGPLLLHNVEQAAATLERLQNFYEWRNPYRTGITLGILMAFWTLITFTPTWLLVQMSFFAIGITFFVLEPLGSHYPRYRLLTSPFTLLMWKVPTHAEWAMARLQAEAAQELSLMRESEIHDDPAVSPVVGHFDCGGDIPGRITVTTTSILYSPDSKKGQNWQLLFTDLRSMHKYTEHSRTKEHESILWVSHDGTHYAACGLAKRDEVFSQIIGYSGLPWKRIE